MSKFVHNFNDSPGARGFRPPQDDQGSFNPPTTGSDPDQYNSSSMNTSSGMGSNNPYCSGARFDDEPGNRGSNFNDTNDPSDRTNIGMGNTEARSDPDTYGSTEMGGGGSTRATSAGSGGINAGPHDSKLANKMDPRVDSDMDNRAQFSGDTNPQMASNASGNVPSYGQPRTQGVDNHESSEDDYNKSTKENNFQSKPDDFNSKEVHETSTQEHKSHSATSHAMPCQMNMQNEPGFDDRASEPNFGGNAAGGSSNTSGARQPPGTQNADPMNKLDPRVTRSNAQSSFADQRSGY